MDQEDNNSGSSGRLRGLSYATSLGFSQAQYEEAIKRIKSADFTDANQLLVALIDVGNSSTTTNGAAGYANGAVTCCANQNGQMVAEPVKTGFATSASLPTAGANAIGTMTSSAPGEGGRDLSNTATTNVSNSTWSSCYSSITSFPSTSSYSSPDQSLESLQQAQVVRKKVYIDGPNVARTHGKDVTFSWLGIKLSFDWFHNRQHRVKVFVPRDRCLQTPTEPTLRYLINLDALVQTPSGCSDDLFIIEAARHNNGVIVSNDLYRDEKRFNDELKNFIHLHRLPYVFDDDLFMPASDPRGRTGPSLDEFLKDIPEQQQHHHHGKLSRAKSHQRYQRNAYSVKYQSSCHKSLQSTLSLPVEQFPKLATTTSLLSDFTNQPAPTNGHTQGDQQQQQPQVSLLCGDHHHQDHRSYFKNCHNYNHNSNPYPNQQRHQQVDRAMSVAYPSSNAREEETIRLAPTGAKQALCRTKSQNI